MNKKPFNKDLYDKDDSAKYQVIKWLRNNGHEAQVNPERYGIDVLASKAQQEYQYEVEVKHNWKGITFQYDTLHYSDRKRKFLTNPSNTFFVTLNHDRTHALLVPGLILSTAPTIIKDTIYTRGEKFIEVKVSDCTIIPMPELEELDVE
jgi:hypothetical protein